MSEKKMNDEFYDNLYMALRDAIYEAIIHAVLNLNVKIKKNGWIYEIEVTNKKSPK